MTLKNKIKSNTLLINKYSKAKQNQNKFFFNLNFNDISKFIEIGNSVSVLKPITNKEIIIFIKIISNYFNYIVLKNNNTNNSLLPIIYKNINIKKKLEFMFMYLKYTDRNKIQSSNNIPKIGYFLYKSLKFIVNLESISEYYWVNRFSLNNNFDLKKEFKNKIILLFIQNIRLILNYNMYLKNILNVFKSLDILKNTNTKENVYLS